MDAAPNRPVEFVRQLAGHVMRDDAIGLSAELAYRFFLSIFPFAIFLTALGGAIARQLEVENPADQAVDLLTGILPEQAAGLIGSELQSVIDRESGNILSIGAVLALWFATGGTNALIKAANRVHAVEEARPFWKRYLLALGLTLLAGGAIIAAFVLFVGGRMVGEDLATEFGLGEIWPIVSLARWPIVVMLVVVAVMVLYRLAPALRSPLRWVLPGAVLFTVGWLLATFGFSVFVTQFADYGATYGTLAGVVIILIWFYLTAFLLLLGIEVNEVLAEMSEPERLEELRVESMEGESGRRDERARRAA